MPRRRVTSPTAVLRTQPDWRLCLLVSVCALVSSGCGSTAPSDTDAAPAVQVDSHQRMLDRLQEIRESSRTTDEYFQDRSVTQAEAQLEAMGEAIPVDERFGLHWQLGDDLLRLGRNDEAIKHLEQAQALVPAVASLLKPEHHELLLQDLAVAWLRVGEASNCVNCTNGESCLFPIQAGGVHLKREGSSNAILYLKKLLERNPNHPTGRWLLNVANMTLGEYPDAVPEEFLIPAEALQSEQEFPRFQEVAAQTGLRVVDCSGGAIADDFDGDGQIDLVTSSWDRSVPLRFFHNRGDGTFENRSQEAGFEGLLGGLNLIQADYDNDGDLDIYVLRGAWLDETLGQHPNSLLENDGEGHFRDVTFDVGLGEHHFPTQTAAWADFDNDGWLDLYVGNERGPSRLYRSQQDGTFQDVTREAGVPNLGMAKGVVWGDYDGDGWMDLYVSNLGMPNRLYRNNRDGTFVDVAEELGVTGPIMSLPVWFWDYNNDGALDLYVPSYVVGLKSVVDDYLDRGFDIELDCLYEGDGLGGFREVAGARNLHRATMPMGCNFGDVDNDGWLDFYLGTGFTDFYALVPNLMFRNQSGQRFADITAAGGVGHLQKGHATAFADFDGDGDLDVFIQTGGAYPADAFSNVLFQNAGTDNNWIEVQLAGTKSNRSAIGATIRVTFEDNGQPREVFRHVNSGGSFGASPLRQHIGIGQAQTVDEIEIRWPGSGTVTRRQDVNAGERLRIQE